MQNGEAASGFETKALKNAGVNLGVRQMETAMPKDAGESVDKRDWTRRLRGPFLAAVRGARANVDAKREPREFRRRKARRVPGPGEPQQRPRVGARLQIDGEIIALRSQQGSQAELLGQARIAPPGERIVCQLRGENLTKQARRQQQIAIGGRRKAGQLSMGKEVPELEHGGQRHHHVAELIGADHQDIFKFALEEAPVGRKDQTRKSPDALLDRQPRGIGGQIENRRRRP